MVGQVFADQVETPATMLRTESQPAIPSNIGRVLMNWVSANGVVPGRKIRVQFGRQLEISRQRHGIRRRQAPAPSRSIGRRLAGKIGDLRNRIRKRSGALRRRLKVSGG